MSLFFVDGPASIVWRMKHELEFSDVMRNLVAVQTGHLVSEHDIHTTIVVRTKPLIRSLSAKHMQNGKPIHFKSTWQYCADVLSVYLSYSLYIFAEHLQWPRVYDSCIR